MRVLSVLLLIPTLALSTPAGAGESSRQATLYKNPQCGCCEGYADYLRDNGFEVTVKPTHDLPLLHRQHGVPEPLVGCHTTLVDGYVVEGHAPIGAVLRAPRHQGHLTARHARRLARHVRRQNGAFHDLRDRRRAGQGVRGRMTRPFPTRRGCSGSGMSRFSPPSQIVCTARLIAKD